MVWKIKQLIREILNSKSRNSTNFDYLSEISEEFQIGTVVDVFPHTGSYLVQTSTNPQLNCTDLQAQVSVLGVRGFSTYPIGSFVFIYTPDTSWGIIIGAIPYNSDEDSLYAESILQGSNVGILKDLAYNFPFTALKNAGGIYNFASGRPIDTLPGDWGFVNNLGVSLGISAGYGWFQASELAKLEFSNLDNYVRLVAANLDIFTSGSEERYVNDEGEFSRIYCSTPFSWEALSAAAPEIEVFTTNEEEDETNAKKAYVEPIYDDQVGLWRHLKLEGYLGGIDREYVLKPPTTGPDYLSRDLASRDYLALLEIQKNLDGFYAVRSAKGVLFEKTCIIPAPVAVRNPEDPEGDSSNGEYVPTDWPEWGEITVNSELIMPDSNPVLKAMVSDEEISYLTNWFYINQIKKHKKDWHVPEEGEVVEKFAQTSDSILGKQYAFPVPNASEVAVDHRTTEKYYAGKAKIQMTDDGGIILEDAYGSQIHMTGGNIYLTCPGSIFTQPGKSLISMAGEDIILRARHHADLTTSIGDIRIKAEENCHILAGNSNSGGILIESKSQGAFDVSGTGTDMKTSGIILKSAGDTNILSNGVCIKSSGDLNLEGVNITSKSDTFWRRMETRAIDEFISSTTDNTVFNSFSPSEAHFDTDINIGGKVRVYQNELHVSGKIIGDSLSVFKGVDSAGRDTIGKVQEVIVSPPYSTDEANRENFFENTLLTQIENYLSNAEDRNFNDEKVEKLGFSLRTSTQYNLGEDFIIPETKWQRRYKTLGSAPVWSEREVINPANNEKTFPFPGYDIWKTDKTRFKSVKQKFYNIQNKCAVNLADVDSVTEIGYEIEVDSGCLDEKYLVSIE
jgi:hypothetical protein